MLFRHAPLAIIGSLLIWQTFANSAELAIKELHPRIEEATFVSSTLGRETRFCAVLPESFHRQTEDWPALFLLHGRGRNCRSLIDDEAARECLLKADFVIVLPQGDDGWYVDSPVRPEDKYASALAETIDAARRHYGLTSQTERLGLSGWSMGGYGCVTYAVRHPEQFGVVAPIIGLLDFPRGGLPEGQSYKVPVQRFGTDPTIWSEFNPRERAEQLRGSEILLITAEQAFDRTMNENFHRTLESADINHDWVVLPGGHTFEVVREALPLVIDFSDRAFSRPRDPAPAQDR